MHPRRDNGIGSDPADFDRLDSPTEEQRQRHAVLVQGLRTMQAEIHSIRDMAEKSRVSPSWDFTCLMVEFDALLAAIEAYVSPREACEDLDAGLTP